MLIELLLEGAMFLLLSFFQTLGITISFPMWFVHLVDLLRFPLSLFPADVWIFLLSYISLWSFIHLTWAIFEWIYKKIPGVS